MIAPGRGAQRAQDRDVGLLVGDRHHQGGDDVERGHRDDQQQDDEHHVLLDLHRAEEIGVAARPVAIVQRRGRASAAASRATWRESNRSCELQAHAGDLVLHAVQLLRVLEVDQRQAGIVLEHADSRRCRPRGTASGAARCPPASPAPAARSASPCRRRLTRERARELAPSTMPNSPGSSASRRAGLHVAADLGDLVLALGQDAAHDRAAHRAVEDEHALRVDVGRRGEHARIAAAAVSAMRCQSARRSPGPLICTCDATPRMRARSSFWKPFITDSTDDQRRNAERDADHRDAAR